MSVKKQLIKLGSTNPELREHIRPVLASMGKKSKLDDAIGKAVLEAAEEWGEKVAHKNANDVEKALKDYVYGQGRNSFYPNDPSLEWILVLEGEDSRDYYEVFFSLLVEIEASAFKDGVETSTRWYIVVLTADGKELLVTDGVHLERNVEHIVRVIEGDIALKNR